MKLLVTGATGFIGSWVTKKLSSLGHSVRILRRKESDTSEIEDLSIEHCIGDILDFESLNQAMKGVDSVFHLAGKIAYSRKERASMQNINVKGTKNVITACQFQNIRKLLHVSSVVTIGASFEGKEILNENSPYNLKNVHFSYSETKKEAEDLVLEAVKKNTLNAIVVNPGVVYGPGDVRKSSRKVPLKVARGEFPFYAPGGLSIAYIEDVVDGILKAWENGKKGERYILAGENLKIKKVFELISKESGVSPPRWLIPSFILKPLSFTGDLMEKVNLKYFVNSEQALVSSLFHWFDSSKAKKELGYQSRSADYAIAQSVKWMKDQNLL